MPTTYHLEKLYLASNPGLPANRELSDHAESLLAQVQAIADRKFRKPAIGKLEDVAGPGYVDFYFWRNADHDSRTRVRFCRAVIIAH